jgi:hypothetical protein
LHEVTQQAKQGQLEVQLSSSDLAKIKDEINKASYRNAGALAGAAFIIGATTIKALDGYATTTLFGMPVLSWLFGSLGALLLYISLTR